MMKINEFCELYRISRYRLAACLEIEPNEGETEQQLMKRKDEFVRRRAGSGWEMMYIDGDVTMRSPRGGLHRHPARELDDFIASN